LLLLTQVTQRECRGIKSLLEFPVDGKKLHGRACYCNLCKRLRCRAQNVSKEFDVAWLRSALLAGELRERLGEHADAVLSVHQADKPVTTHMSPDATIEWAGDSVIGRRSGAGGKSSGGARRSGGRSNTGDAGAAWDDATAFDSCSPGQEHAHLASAHGGGGFHDSEAAHNGGYRSTGVEYDETPPALMTRRILMEHREFSRMYLAVREHLLQPGITEDQVAVDEQTAAELELHMQHLREMIGHSFLGHSG
jgi:hypothetical protein